LPKGRRVAFEIQDGQEGPEISNGEVHAGVTKERWERINDRGKAIQIPRREGKQGNADFKDLSSRQVCGKKKKYR